MKATDWILGFASSVAGNHKEMLTLGDELAFEGAPKGCEPGCRCCGSYLEGKEILRCVEKEGITKTTSWWNRQKCKNYKPTDIQADRKWKHVKDEFRCSPRNVETSSFNSTWKANEQGDWVMKDYEDETDL